MSGMTITFDVAGSPAPKGSGRAMLIGGKARHVPSGSSVNARRIRSWDGAVREAAARAVGTVAAPPFVGVALAATITFRLVRPAGHWGKRGLKPSAPAWPIPKPDADKLTRQTWDSMIGIVYDDDSRICRSVVQKEYAAPGREGATICVCELR